MVDIGIRNEVLYSLVCEGFTYDGVVLLSRNSVLLDTKLTFCLSSCCW